MESPPIKRWIPARRFIGSRHRAPTAPAVVVGARYARRVKPSIPATTSTAERPALIDQDRAERLGSLAQRLRDPDGLDRDTLAQIEQLTATEQ